ncbi:unnamed protein product [Vitrella brassicaformis CCMP3155]|uniref:Uncharacterized protein n=1 Tax=Vitrella brassicaformis (strain CCMP3155) TaxID=1169540 RepID=A0A0G4H7M2_VITBC|nr:unnamed protein product [Vitrella brassicaformis CCMP3155]|eukprot:CEM39863.1 unnamed protein product [Vitrella brassicaformis CCMP3155]
MQGNSSTFIKTTIAGASVSLSALLEEGSGGVKYVVLRFLPVISIAALRSCNAPYCSKIMDRPCMVQQLRARHPTHLPVQYDIAGLTDANIRAVLYAIAPHGESLWQPYAHLLSVLQHAGDVTLPVMITRQHLRVAGPQPSWYFWLAAAGPWDAWILPQTGSGVGGSAYHGPSHPRKVTKTYRASIARRDPSCDSSTKTHIKLCISPPYSTPGPVQQLTEHLDDLSGVTELAWWHDTASWTFGHGSSPSAVVMVDVERSRRRRDEDTRVDVRITDIHDKAGFSSCRQLDDNKAKASIFATDRHPDNPLADGVAQFDAPRYDQRGKKLFLRPLYRHMGECGGGGVSRESVALVRWLSEFAERYRRCVEVERASMFWHKKE